MSLAAFCANMSAPIGQFIMSQSKFKLGLQLNLMTMTVLSILSFIFISNKSADGAALSFFLAYLFHIIISIFILNKKTKKTKKTLKL